MDKPKKHWGEWVESRAKFVGLGSRRDFLKALDVTSRQLDRWLKSDQPASMHQRNLLSLIRALRTDEDTLFGFKWQCIYPEAAELVGPVQMPPKSQRISHAESGNAALRREIRGISEALAGEHLAALAADARKEMQRYITEKEKRHKAGTESA